MRISDERLAEFIEHKAMPETGKHYVMGVDCSEVALDLRDERALCDRLAEALRAVLEYRGPDAEERNRWNVARWNAGSALAAYDKERGR